MASNTILSLLGKVRSETRHKHRISSLFFKFDQCFYELIYTIKNQSQKFYMFSSLRFADETNFHRYYRKMSYKLKIISLSFYFKVNCLILRHNKYIEKKKKCLKTKKTKTDRICQKLVN